MMRLIWEATRVFESRKHFPADQIMIGTVDQSHLVPQFDKSYVGKAHTPDGDEVLVHALNWRQVIQDEKGQFTLSKINSGKIHPAFTDQSQIVMVCTISDGVIWAVAWCTLEDWEKAGASLDSLQES